MLEIALPRIESRALKYGYSNARVRAMKGLLLKQNMLEDMIKTGSIEGMVELLQRTGYKNDLASASMNHTGSELIEVAAARNFSAVVQKLMRISPPSDRPILQSLLVKWDLLNLKTLMHAKMLGKAYDDVKHQLFSIGGLTEEDFKRIMKAEQREILKEIKKTELGKQMLSAGTEHFSKRMWEIFKNALENLDTFTQTETIIDAYSYMLMDKGLAETGGLIAGNIRNLLRMEIDAKNVMIIERLKKHGMDAAKIQKRLIKGGTLSEWQIEKLVGAKDLNAVIKLIKPKFRQLKLEDKATLTDLEIALEKSIAAQKLLAFHKKMLSAGVITGFLLLKEEETNNLRKIAKAKEFGIPEDDVRKMLVVV